MNDRDLMQQALYALTYKKWWRVGLGEPKDPKLEAAITSLNERLAHCDRCGKLHGGEGDIHTCSPRLDQGPDYERGFVDGMSRNVGIGTPAAPVQEPVAWMFQHGETGRMSFVSNDGMNNPELFLKMNPRYALVCALVTPPAAQRQHVTDGSLCWCDPETSYTDPETGASVVVHKGPQ